MQSQELKGFQGGIPEIKVCIYEVVQVHSINDGF